MSTHVVDGRIDIMPDKPLTMFVFARELYLTI